MRNIRDFFMLLLFFSLLTYFIMFFKKQEDTQVLDRYGALSELAHNDRYFVTCQENGVTMRLPMENYLIGALAASIPIEYEPEMLKAQAIVLRSTLSGKYQEQDNKGEESSLFVEAAREEFWSDSRMQSIWGDAYEENVKKCMDAVIQTQGIYLAYGDEPVDGFFHGMSAGKTRAGSELSPDGNYSYLKETICADSLSAPEYEEEMKISVQDVGELEEAVTNESGYVISVKRNGKRISGEELRGELKLESSNLTWKKEGKYYIFTTRGKGHGFGLDQYYGNVLAKKGMDYREILDYFFADITYQRME